MWTNHAGFSLAMAARFFGLICLISQISCKSLSDLTQTKAVYTDPNFTGKNSKTWERLETLSRFGNDLLGEKEVIWENGVAKETGRIEPLHRDAVAAFRQNGIDPSRVLPLNRPGNTEKGARGNYRLYLESDTKKCFFLEGFFDKKIESETQLNAIIDQLREIAMFIKTFHVAIDGDVYQSFVPSNVELCSISKDKGRVTEMQWLGNGHLRINIPVSFQGWGGTYRPYSSDDLMKMWNSGLQFSGDDKISEYFKKGWTFFNPISDKRKELINFMRRLVAKIVPKIGSLFDRVSSARSPQEANRPETVNEVKSTAMSNVDAQVLNYNPQQAIDKIAAINKLPEFLKTWKETVEDPMVADAIINAAPAAVADKRDVDAQNISIALVASVSNVHDISAAISVSAASNKYKQYIRVPANTENKTKIRQYCISLIASVCTVDKVDALVNVFIAGGLEHSLVTAGFDQAVISVLGPNWRDQR